MNIEILKRIADQYLLHGLFCDELGLYNGKLGLSIYFYFLSRYIDNIWYEKFADELLENVCKILTADSPIRFSNGLCGIGWGIEFLKHYKFIENNTDEILAEVDEVVMQRDLLRINDDSLSNGLRGIIAYVRARLDSKRTVYKKIFDDNYLNDLDMRCQKMGIDWTSKEYCLMSVWDTILSDFSKDIVYRNLCWQKGLIIINEMYE